MNNHFAAPGKRVQSANEPGLHGTVIKWDGYDVRVVQWDGLGFLTGCRDFDLDLPEEW